jgi:hypothetical protein
LEFAVFGVDGVLKPDALLLELGNIGLLLGR